MFLLLAIIGYIALAIVNIIDKYLVDGKTSLLVFVFYAGIFTLPLFLLIPWIEFPHSLTDYALGFFSGAMFLAALLAMYYGFQKTEVSHSGPLVGVATTLSVLLLSYFFLGERVGEAQLIGIIIIIIGSILISFQKTKETSGMPRAIAWALLAGLLFALSHVSAKYMYVRYDFWSAAVWTKGVMGIYALFLLMIPSVHREIFARKERKALSPKSFSLVVVNRVLSVAGTGLTQYAIALGSVSIVNALQGVQYAVLVVVVICLTRYHSKVFKEFYTRNEIVLQVCAVAVVAGGLGIMMIK
jgi:drug/metabolite transporter (DMT)-like permease